jgi:cell division protein FtsL
MYSSSHSWEKSTGRSRRLLVYLLIVVVTTLLVLHVGARMYILSMGTDIQKIRKDNLHVQAEISGLELQMADLSRGARIKQIASEQLGMIMPVGAPKKLF